MAHFYFDFRSVISKELTWESVFRIRISSGWKIKGIYGTYSVKSSDLLSYPTDELIKKILFYFNLL